MTRTISIAEARRLMGRTNNLPAARIAPAQDGWIPDEEEMDHRAAWAWIQDPSLVDLLGCAVEVSESTGGKREWLRVSAEEV